MTSRYTIPSHLNLVRLSLLFTIQLSIMYTVGARNTCSCSPDTHLHCQTYSSCPSCQCTSCDNGYFLSPTTSPTCVQCPLDCYRCTNSSSCSPSTGTHPMRCNNDAFYDGLSLSDRYGYSNLSSITLAIPTNNIVDQPYTCIRCGVVDCKDCNGSIIHFPLTVSPNTCDVCRNGTILSPSKTVCRPCTIPCCSWCELDTFTGYEVCRLCSGNGTADNQTCICNPPPILSTALLSTTSIILICVLGPLAWSFFGSFFCAMYHGKEEWKPSLLTKMFIFFYLIPLIVLVIVLSTIYRRVQGRRARVHTQSVKNVGQSNSAGVIADMRGRTGCVQETMVVRLPNRLETMETMLHGEGDGAPQHPVSIIQSSPVIPSSQFIANKWTAA